LEDVLREAGRGEVVLIDVRPGHAYARGHVAHSLSAPFVRGRWARAVKEWLGARPSSVAILADNEVVVRAAVEALAGEGITPSDVFAGGPQSWQADGVTLVEVLALKADDLARDRDSWTVIDVREPYEWRSGIIPGALTMPLNQLPDHTSGLDPRERYAVVCASGSRSQAAASYLADRGYQVANVVGGMSLWLAGRHPVEQPAR
jgi:rhodanese-related sulfurtransferase